MDTINSVGLTILLQKAKGKHSFKALDVPLGDYLRKVVPDATLIQQEANPIIKGLVDTRTNRKECEFQKT
ncbi:hypothetical protein CEXT_728621 [Caerostris extrusa]|uniref:Uncharacterized protein n=1 Tax=Caerostris extrusa TaxID=172846 RepID=A0AAV4NEU3_CAEEX|nr:hypothetical protein CEXT_728621 [Caerostris extrusa]